MRILKSAFYKISDSLIDRWRLYAVLLIGAAVCLIMVMGVVPLISGPGEQRQAVSKIAVESEVLKDANLKDGLESRLSEWIYGRSGKISRGQSKLIAVEAMKTNKTLLILALAEHESIGFVPTAVSKKGCVGLMQINFDGNNGVDVNGKMLVRAGIIKEKRDLFEIGYNVRSGDFLLDIYLKKSKGNVLKALDRYLGERDGAYALEVFSNLAELYLLQESVIREEERK